jgi:hypothetical protein
LCATGARHCLMSRPLSSLSRHRRQRKGPDWTGPFVRSAG